MADNFDEIRKSLDDLDEGQLQELRHDINERLIGRADGKVGSADASADDEKRKIIAQHGENANQQLTAQAVPSPVSDEVKDLQNEASLAEHRAKAEQEHGERVSAEQRKKLRG